MRTKLKDNIHLILCNCDNLTLTSWKSLNRQQETLEFVWVNKNIKNIRARSPLAHALPAAPGGL